MNEWERGRKEGKKGGEGDPGWSYWNIVELPSSIYKKAFVDLHNDPMQFFPIKKKILTNKSSH